MKSLSLSFLALLLMAVGAQASTLITPNYNSVFVSSYGSAPPIAGSTRGPLAVWSPTFNPATAPAGQNAACQFWVGSPLTATPGAGDTVLCSFILENTGTMQGHNTYVLDIADFQNPGSPDAINNPVEIEFNNGTNAQPVDPFANNTGARKMGLAFTAQGTNVNTCIYTTCNPTTDLFLWSPDITSAYWPQWNIALSRAVLGGIYLTANPGSQTDTPHSAYGLGAIFDDSNSTTVVRVANSHNSVIDLSGDVGGGIGSGTQTTIAQTFIQCYTNANCYLGASNFANYDVDWTLDSGTSAAEGAWSVYSDRNNAKWLAGKDNLNDYEIVDETNSGQPALTVSPAHVTTIGEAAQTLNLQGTTIQYNGGSTVSATVVIGGCTLVFSNGLLTNKSGC